MKFGNKKTLLTIIMLFIMKLLFAQNEKIDEKKLHEDVNFYFKTIKNVHPDYTAFHNKEEIDEVKKNILKQICEPITINDFAILMEIETKKLFDSHTIIHGAYTTYPEYNIYPNTTLFFPYKVVFEGDNLFYIDDNFIKYKIVSINKNFVENIINDMKRIFSADISLPNKIEQIEKNFSYYYYLIYKENNNFVLNFIDNMEKTTEISVLGVSKEILQLNKLTNNAYIIDNINFRLDLFEDSIALITINTFKLLKDHSYFDFLKNSFKTIAEKGIKYLFIDIKDNGGGSSSNVNVLFDYIFEENYNFLGGLQEVRYSKDYIKNLVSEEKEIAKSDRNKYKYNKKDEYKFDGFLWTRKNNVSDIFTGHLFIIQGQKTASAALDLSSAIKYTRRGIIIGKPTKEPASSFSQGTVFKLPNSKLSFQCATGFFVIPSGSAFDDKWIEPDIDFEFNESPITNETLKKLIENANIRYRAYFE